MTVSFKHTTKRIIAIIISLLLVASFSYIMGNYLVLVENGLKVYKPSAVNLVPEYKDGAWSMTTPAAITVKASELNIEKTVDDTQAGVGDTVNFTVVADVPQYPASAKNTTYKISDTPSAGLTVNETTIKVYGVKGTDETELTAGFAKTNGFHTRFHICYYQNI